MHYKVCCVIMPCMNNKTAKTIKANQMHRLAHEISLMSPIFWYMKEQPQSASGCRHSAPTLGFQHLHLRDLLPPTVLLGQFFTRYFSTGRGVAANCSHISALGSQKGQIQPSCSAIPSLSTSIQFCDPPAQPGTTTGTSPAPPGGSVGEALVTDMQFFPAFPSRFDAEEKFLW